MQTFELTDNQAEAILNMRLRAYAGWKRWRSATNTRSCPPSTRACRRCWTMRASAGQNIGDEIAEVTGKIRPAAPLGERRTDEHAPRRRGGDPTEALVEREAITVILSEKGWIRAQKGHLAEEAD